MAAVEIKWAGRVSGMRARLARGSFAGRNVSNFRYVVADVVIGA
jgi:hypothetical protein